MDSVLVHQEGSPLFEFDVSINGLKLEVVNKHAQLQLHHYDSHSNSWKNKYEAMDYHSIDWISNPIPMQYLGPPPTG